MTASLYKLLNNPSDIDYKVFDWPVPMTNSSTGYPYPNQFIRPFYSHPSHVIPDGCAWYNQLGTDRRSCVASKCPEKTVEMFRGKTPQRTHSNGEEKCPRQHKVRVEATFCCDKDVFKKNVTVGQFSMDVKDWLTSDCQWIGSTGVCWGEEQSCPVRKYRHEVARAADASIHSKDAKNKTTIDSSTFGSACEVGDRILCCKDKAFTIQETIDAFLNTELNYFFPMLIQKKNKYEGKRVKLIFAPGATKPPPTAATKKISSPTVPTVPVPSISPENKDPIVKLLQETE